MSRPTPRHLFLCLIAIGAILGGVLGLPAGIASAHNTLVSSDPADGASLTLAPTQITWVFDKDVPLETLTVTLIGVDGVRSDLGGSFHGPTGETEVITPLPVVQPGANSLRWRLVGPDGHPITGRVDFTLATVTTTPPTTAPVVGAAAGSAPATTTPPATTPPANGELLLAASDQDDGSFSTPSPVRWLLRYSSYLAIMSIVGILLVSAAIWSAAGAHPLLRRIMSAALIATAALALAQLLVIAGDVSGRHMWASFGSLDGAIATDAGMALAIRIVLALTMWLVLFQYRLANPDVYWTAVALPGLGLLATWAFAGHSRSLRWPVLGVVTDVAHHAAAAAWIVGLAVTALLVIPGATAEMMAPTVRRFSRVARASVVVLIVTGLIQTVRLVGNPTGLLDVRHGKYLVVKVVVLGAMLAVANVNRRRVHSGLDDATTGDRHIHVLRQAVLVEFALGLAIVAITAAMVVSPPAIAQLEAGASGDVPQPITPTP